MGIGEYIYAAPFDAEAVLRIDVSSSTPQLSLFSTTAVQTGRCKWDGTVAVGTIVYAPPFDAEMILGFDTATGVASSAVANNGIIYAAPYRCDILLAFRVSTGEVAGLETTAAYPGVAFIDDTNPYRAEWDRPSYYKPGVKPEIPGGPVPGKWSGMAVLGTGCSAGAAPCRLYAVPLDANCVLEVDVSVASFTFQNPANASRRLEERGSAARNGALSGAEL